MLRVFFIAAFALVSVYAGGEFIVLNNLDSVAFDGSDPMNQSILQDIFTSILGFTVQPNRQYKGLKIKRPFSLPEGAVNIVIEGVDTINYPGSYRVKLNLDESEERTWQVIRQRLEDRDKNNTVIRIRVGDGFDALGQSSLGELKPNYINEALAYLNPNSETDNQFIREVQLLRAIAQKVSSTIIPNSRPDIYWFIVSGLGPVMNYYGESSDAAREALELLQEALIEIQTAFERVYKGKVFIAAVPSNPNAVKDDGQRTFSRVRRALQDPDAVSTTEKSNKAVNNNGTIENKLKDEDEIKITSEDEGSNITTEAYVEIITESNYITESNEPVGGELNPLTHESHSQTDSENTDLPVKPKDMNLAPKYDDNYPAIFNILLWIVVVLIFSLISICITIIDMDPGRDSVNYRMTSNRMKKEN